MLFLRFCLLLLLLKLIMARVTIMDKLYEEIKHSVERKRSYINDDIGANLENFLSRTTMVKPSNFKEDNKMDNNDTPLLNATSRSIFKATMSKNIFPKVKVLDKTKNAAYPDIQVPLKTSDFPSKLLNNSKALSENEIYQINNTSKSAAQNDASNITAELKEEINDEAEMRPSRKTDFQSKNITVPKIISKPTLRFRKNSANPKSILSTDDYSGSAFYPNSYSEKAHTNLNEFFNLDEKLRNANIKLIKRQSRTIARLKRSLQNHVVKINFPIYKRYATDDNDWDLDKVNYDSMNNYLQKEIDSINENYKDLDINNISPNHPISKLLASQYNDIKKAYNLGPLNSERNYGSGKNHISSHRPRKFGRKQRFNEKENGDYHGNNNVNSVEKQRNIKHIQRGHHPTFDGGNNAHNRKAVRHDYNNNDNSDKDDNDDMDYEDTYRKDRESYHRSRFHHIKVKLHGPGKSPEEWAVQEQQEIAAMPEGLAADSQVISTGAGFFQLDENGGDIEITSSRDHGTKVKMSGPHFNVIRNPFNTLLGGLSYLRPVGISENLKIPISKFNQHIFIDDRNPSNIIDARNPKKKPFPTMDIRNATAFFKQNTFNETVHTEIDTQLHEKLPVERRVPEKNISTSTKDNYKKQRFPSNEKISIRSVGQLPYKAALITPANENSNFRNFKSDKVTNPNSFKETSEELLS